MNAKTKSSKLLCSISSGDVTEPVMRVFDVDLKEEDERGFCSSQFRKSREMVERYTHKAQNTLSKLNVTGDYLMCQTEPSRRRTKQNHELQPICENILKKYSETASQMLLLKNRQTLPSNHQYPFKPTLSKRSQELAKVRSNLNLTVFQNLYCKKAKCNHNFDSRERPARHSHNSRGKKSSGKTIREQAQKKPQPRLYEADRSLSPGERRADDNLLEFLNRKLLQRR